jgi:hypothetical protein
VDPLDVLTVKLLASKFNDLAIFKLVLVYSPVIDPFAKQSLLAFTVGQAGGSVEKRFLPRHEWNDFWISNDIYGRELSGNGARPTRLWIQKYESCNRGSSLKSPNIVFMTA